MTPITNKVPSHTTNLNYFLYKSIEKFVKKIGNVTLGGYFYVPRQIKKISQDVIDLRCSIKKLRSNQAILKAMKRSSSLMVRGKAQKALDARSRKIRLAEFQFGLSVTARLAALVIPHTESVVSESLKGLRSLTKFSLSVVQTIQGEGVKVLCKIASTMVAAHLFGMLSPENS